MGFSANMNMVRGGKGRIKPFLWFVQSYEERQKLIVSCVILISFIVNFEQTFTFSTRYYWWLRAMSPFGENVGLDTLVSMFCFMFKGIVKWAEPDKCDILLVSRIMWRENHPFFKRMDIFVFDTHRQLSVWSVNSVIVYSYPAAMYLFKVSNGNTRSMYEVCSKLKTKPLEQNVFSDNF